MQKHPDCRADGCRMQKVRGKTRCENICEELNGLELTKEGQIEIGEYLISAHGDHFWIMHEDGEGMRVSEQKLLEEIKNIWNKHF